MFFCKKEIGISGFGEKRLLKMGLIVGMKGDGGEGNDRETLSCPSWSRRELEEMMIWLRKDYSLILYSTKTESNSERSSGPQKACSFLLITQ